MLEPRRQDKLQPNNKSGIKGVYFQKSTKSWIVTWGADYYGCSKDFFEACCMRKSAEARSRADPANKAHLRPAYRWNRRKNQMVEEARSTA